MKIEDDAHSKLNLSNLQNLFLKICRGIAMGCPEPLELNSRWRCSLPGRIEISDKRKHRIRRNAEDGVRGRSKMFSNTDETEAYHFRTKNDNRNERQIRTQVCLRINYFRGNRICDYNLRIHSLKKQREQKTITTI